MVVLRLSGAPEANRMPPSDYAKRIDKWFSPYHPHDAVKWASRLRFRVALPAESILEIAACVGPPPELEERSALEPLPRGIDSKWKTDEARQFVAHLRAFAVESRFGDFLVQESSFHEAFAETLLSHFDSKDVRSCGEEFFGAAPRRGLVVTGALLWAGGDLSLRPMSPNGAGETIRIIGARRLDDHGIPEVDTEDVEAVMSEVARTHLDPIVAGAAKELGPGADKLFERVKGRVSAIGVRTGLDLVGLSLGRAVAIRRFRSRGDDDNAIIAIGRAACVGLPWTGDTDELLAKFSGGRKTWPAFDSFVPEVKSYFDALAARPVGELEAPLFHPPAAVLQSFARADGLTIVTPVISASKTPKDTEAVVKKLTAWHAQDLAKKGVPIFDADSLPDDQVKGRALFAVGSPMTNGTVYNVLKRCLIVVRPEQITFAGREFSGDNLILAAALRSPFDSKQPIVIITSAGDHALVGAETIDFGFCDYVFARRTGERQFAIIRRGRLRYLDEGRIEMVE